MNMLSTSDCAAYGQRRLTFTNKHLDKITSLKNQKKDYPKKKDNSDYQIKSRAEPQLTFSVSEWDASKLPVM